MDNEWEELVLKTSKRFNVLADFDFLLFVIGIQERGLGFIKYSKEEKTDLINLSRCVLFQKAGYYQQDGVDEGNWPQFKVVKKVDKLLPSEREGILKKAMIAYFAENL